MEQLRGVKAAAPLLEQTATIRGPQGNHVTVELAGADISLTVLDGLAHTIPRGTLTPGGIGLSKASAEALGIKSSAQASKVSLQLGGKTLG